MESIAILSYAKKDSPILLYSRSFDSDNDINSDLFDKDDIFSMESESSFTIPSASISSQFRIMSVMEEFDDLDEMERKGIERRSDDEPGFYLGFVAVMDDLRFYGYRTSTNIRIIIGIKDDLLPSNTALIKQREDSIQKVLTNVHQTYVNYLMNPFSKPGKAIKCKKFDNLIQKMVNDIV